MSLEKIFEDWKKDSAINDLALDRTAVDGALLHSKYIEQYSIAKLTLKRKQATHAILKRDKWLYYNGKMSKEEMDVRHWDYDPWQGKIKPLKSEIEMFIETDDDIMRSNGAIDYQKTIVECFDEIVSQIKWRHQTIKNILEAKKFYAGG